MSARPGDAAGSWTNWAGNVFCAPARIAHPTTFVEVADVLRGARDEGITVRPVGSGHSFTPAVETDGVLVDLRAMSGLDGVERVADPGAVIDTTTTVARVWVRAGTTLRSLNATLAHLGLAIPNLGDIDAQTLAGAVSTGTHGTGVGFTGLAGCISALRIVLPNGDLVECSPQERADVFSAAVVGLGAFGVVVALRLDCVAAFRLRAHERPERWEAVLARIDALPHEADHVEFFWFPGTNRVSAKFNTRVSSADTSGEPLPQWRRLLDDELLANGLFEGFNRVGARVPRLVPVLNRASSRALSARTYTAPSPAVFASPRRVRFRETEYALPVEAAADVLRDLRAALERRAMTVTFPVEVRFAGADDRWLSTGYERRTVYVAAHQYVRADHREFFALVEDVMGAYDGRPHWGKMHRLDAAALAELYPRFDDVRRVRADVDPHGLMRNAYLDRVLGWDV